MKVLLDLLYIYFFFKYYPDNYGPCRFWEKEKSEWRFYYGSTYDPYQRQKLQRFVQRYDYQILYNDKELWNQFAKGLKVSMPRYYGAIDPAEHYKKKIIDMLHDNNRQLIIKPIQGSAGKGIVLARRTSKGIEIKTPYQCYEIDKYELVEKCVMQEFIEQHSLIAAIASSSVNTIRLVTLWTKDEDVILVSVSMRFGQGASFIDNWSAGGLCIGVDLTTGALMKYGFDKNGKRFAKHPVSGVEFNEFQIPMWNEVVDMAIAVQKSSPFYRMLGCDIAVSSSGPVLIEVNAQPDIVMQEQVSGPLLSNKRVFDEFKNYDLLINKYQKTLYK